MAVCDESCNCEAEGDRGLVVTGTGDNADPFVVAPDTDRTIPSTWDTYSDLPALSADEIGQLAFVVDTGLLYVWSDSADALEDGWQVVAPDWDAIAVGNTAIDATGVQVVMAGIALRDGRWDIIASGYADVTVVANTTCQITFELIDTVSGTIYARTVCSLVNDDGVNHARTMPYVLQAMVTSGPGSLNPAGTDKTVAVRFTRDLAEASVGVISNTAVRAVRCASHSVF